ncbi:cystathionine beta-lyase [Pseudaminobacter sp. 19-2017]|uniref:Cystathionine beta-lyase n=1 Tax=Pseudaminobacter soli (ex Zhang et al. 2022) TaxID=2831468 RepID=A0A942E1C8_9HYPH|nr:cystathionine beta-lyase [Pseudaminobacter soli]MBS3651959.1 cystathionine beta-lyase [Pseudaminobacter soli]
MKTETRLLRAEPASDAGFASLAVPVTRASTIVFPTSDAFERRYEQFYDGYTYGLYGTPTSRTLEARISELYAAEHCLCLPSGQSATVLALSALLKAGDRVLVAASAYGSTRTFCTDMLAAFGVEVVLYDPTIASGIGALIDDRTRVVVVESPGSNTMEIQDIPTIVQAAHALGARVLADNTWASALHCNPLDLGADMVMEALSKHAGGHADVLIGALVTRNEALFRRMKDVSRLMGLGVSADDASLALRGLQTMPLRMEREGVSALTLAHWLIGRPEIARVLHPALPGDPGHHLWKRDFRGASGLFSVELAVPYQNSTSSFVDALRIFRIGASWGSTHSIVTPQVPFRSNGGPGSTSRKLIRFSIGLEPVEDLQADIEAALAVLSAGTTHSVRKHAVDQRELQKEER